MLNWLARLRDLNPRWLYAATLVLLVIPLVVDIPMPRGQASQATLGVWRALDSCPADKVVLVDSSWDMGSQAENKAQLECVITHLCRKRIRFVVTSVGVSQFAPALAKGVIDPIAAKAGYVYGRDWVNCGFVQSGASLGAVLEGLFKDFHAVRPTDMAGTPAARLPLLDRVRSAKDIHAVCVITYSPPSEWISFVHGQFGTPVAFACMSINAPHYYTYLDSGQLCGALIGNRGAAQYEALNGEAGLGTKLMALYSFGNCTIIAAAVLGNLGMWAARRQRRAGP
jgi:hypothetical protein